MKKSNYQRTLDQTLQQLDAQGGPKPSLLLHACCGPCSSYVIEYLSAYFDITILYYNPNISPESEYRRRLEELQALLLRLPDAVKNNITMIEDHYDAAEFYQAIRIREEPERAREKEKGERCRRCYAFRMERAYKYAAENSFDYFTTTLSISPFKDADKINEIGNALAHSGKPYFLVSDFKKKGGFKRSLELSREYGLYRQDYCGCVYSKNNKEEERLRHATQTSQEET